MILIVDTSSSGLRFALGGKTKTVASEKQSVALPLEVEKFLAESGLPAKASAKAGAAFRDLTAIGVVVGPGSFTGIRIGIAYAKGLAIGLNIPVLPVNAFEIYLERAPDAFVALDTGRGDFFVGGANLPPAVMTIDEVETEQMKYACTVGHEPYDLADALPIVERKLAAAKQGRGGLKHGDTTPPVIPMYLRPHYAEQNRKSS